MFLPHRPAMLLGIYLTDLKSMFTQDTADLYLYSLFIIAKLKTTNTAFNTWMNKQTVVYPHNRILFINKMKGPIRHKKTYLNLKCISLNKRSQSEKLYTGWF